MSPPQLEPEYARQVVEARLGRPPQDMLEAAVVLEAWAGVPAMPALETGGDILRAAEPSPEASTGSVPEPPETEGFATEAVAFMLAVLAMASWTAPLARDLGAAVVERGLIAALPVTLALQWWLRSRFLGRPDGLAQLGRRPARLVISIAALGAAFAAALGPAGGVAALLTLTWAAGTVLVRRRWAVAYAVLVTTATACMLAGAPALLVLTATTNAAMIAVAAALHGQTLVSGAAPRRPWRAVGAGIIGAGLGVMLVADPSVNWGVGGVPALALLPSTAASFWGGYHLWRFQQVIPRALAGVAVRETGVGPAWPALRVLLGATARLLIGCAVLSVLLVLLAERLGAEVHGHGVFVAFGLLALVSLVVALLESVGRGGWALFAVTAAVGAEVAVHMSGVAPFPGSGLVAGAAVGLLIALPAAVALLRSPARTLATALWIA